MTPAVEAEPPRRGPVETRTLSQVWRVFVGQRSPRFLVGLTGVLLGFRARAGDFGAQDLILLVGVLLLHPFIEWALHVYVLHLKPFRVGSRTVELGLARYHRYHHGDPWDLRWVFMPLLDTAVGLAMLMTVLGFALPNWPLRLTAMTASAAACLVYEWLHFLTHTGYRPRSDWYQRIRRHHRLHHFKNENYWQGVSRHLADLVLGTMPDASSVPTSKTARTLGVDVADPADSP
jgi:hypothetical protein